MDNGSENEDDDEDDDQGKEMMVPYVNLNLEFTLGRQY